MKRIPGVKGESITLNMILNNKDSRLLTELLYFFNLRA
jgi:hypothetical protein